MQRGINMAAILAVVIAFGLILIKNSPGNRKDSLLNVSYDPTRELYHTLAELGYRPCKSQFMQNNAQFAPIHLFPVTAIARDWAEAQEKFFADNGIIDSVLHEKRP